MTNTVFVVTNVKRETTRLIAPPLAGRPARPFARPPPSLSRSNQSLERARCVLTGILSEMSRACASMVGIVVGAAVN